MTPIHHDASKRSRLETRLVLFSSSVVLVSVKEEEEEEEEDDIDITRSSKATFVGGSLPKDFLLSLIHI